MFSIVRIIFLLYFISLYQSFSLERRTLYSPIVSFLPQLKVHHVVLISASQKKKTYTIDFSPLPVDTSFIKAQLLLLFAFNVPGEVRIRHIENDYRMSDEEILTEWVRKNDLPNNSDGIASQKVTNEVIQGIDDADIITLLDKVKAWDTTMNLYTHNCQHFSHFVNKITLGENQAR